MNEIELLTNILDTITTMKSIIEFGLGSILGGIIAIIVILNFKD